MDRLLTGLQPSGALTIGNYAGGISQIVNYQKDYETFLFVPDINAIAMYIACGVDPDLENMHIYIQSENLYHANLSWIFECHTPHGDLTRMHQFKAKSALHETFTEGLVTYPDLMAADILLYDPKYVPTGIDQKQHVELARNIAIRFNNRYGELFRVPEPMIPTIGAKIRDLQNPEQKMSKSTANPKASVFLSDTEKQIRKKIMSAVTDSDGVIKFDEENKPGVSNLLTIYSVFSGCSIEDAVAKFEGGGYGDLKKGVADVVVEKLMPVQENYEKVISSGRIDEILDAGREFSNKIAEEKYERVRKAVGFGRI